MDNPEWKLTHHRDAPPQHQRMTVQKLTEAATVLKVKLGKAEDVIIKQLKRERTSMKSWLEEKGVRIEVASIYDDVQLMQFIFYWHTLEPAEQRQILEAQPLLYLTVPQPKEGDMRDAHQLNTTDVPSAGNNLCFTQELEVFPLIFVKGRRFLKPDKIQGKVTPEAVIKAYLTRANYDGAWATVVKRWDLSQLVTSESEGPTNLYATQPLAHELTHMQQTLFDIVYPAEKRAVEARTRFYFLGGVTPTCIRKSIYTAIYRINREADGIAPSQRSLRDTQRERLEFIGNRKLHPAPGAATEDRLRLLGKLQLSNQNGLEIVGDILERIFVDINDIITAAAHNGQPNAPTVDPQWVVKFKGLSKYMSGKWNGFSAIQGLDLIPAVTRNPAEALIDTVIDLINSDTTFSGEEHAKLQNEVSQLSRWGLTTVVESLKVFEIKRSRSIEIQKQTCRLFPSIIGSFTDYSNTFFKAAVAQTKGRLREVLMTGQGEVLQLLPQPFFDSLAERRRRYDLAPGKDANLEKISSLEWYEMGAQLGFFNNYSQEYDAEMNAMWLLTPEEFVDMYKRWDARFAADNMREILNQATYASVHGTTEYGRVPEYVD